MIKSILILATIYSSLIMGSQNGIGQKRLGAGLAYGTDTQVQNCFKDNKCGAKYHNVF